jgi:TolA-binding protein
LVVAVPDGLIEDIGTRFVVDVRAGRVQRIEVSEGAVLFHRSAGLGAVSIVAPAIWSAAEAPKTLGSAASTAPHAAPAATPATSSTASAVPVAPPPVAARQVGVAPAASSVPQFGDALALIRSGQPAAAAVKLRAFLVAHPTAPNVEDATYLLVVALTRSATRAEAKDAARAYLARFPKGFRRHEVEQILND